MYIRKIFIIAAKRIFWLAANVLLINELMPSRYKNRVLMLLPDPNPEVLEFGTDHYVWPQLHDLKIEISPEEYVHFRISKHFFSFPNQNGGQTFFVNLKENISEEQRKILLAIGALRKQE